ncbi:MAG: MogA/MoaB family molybdenum cofactor biosynthesis protein [Anaerolineae bacterium]|jgi:molybdenum cofactor synthesis domain-containing protein|nr:MogA/MoaB family molybdenum cofactor biosynthesis protein [Anaerolineae bacterium]
MINVAILIVSDRSSRGEREDATGPLLSEYISSLGWHVAAIEIVPDEAEMIKHYLVSWSDTPGIDIILTSGGTGFTPRDITPDVTASVYEKPVPGLVEYMRMEGLRYTRHSMLSRAVAGIRKETLIINLPGSPTGAVQNLTIIHDVLPHAIDLLKQSPNAEHDHQSS